MIPDIFDSIVNQELFAAPRPSVAVPTPHYALHIISEDGLLEGASWSEAHNTMATAIDNNGEVYKL